MWGLMYTYDRLSNAYSIILSWRRVVATSDFTWELSKAKESRRRYIVSDKSSILSYFQRINKI